MDDAIGFTMSSASGASTSAHRSNREPDPVKGGDVYGWAVEQAALIRTGRYDKIDWVNIADEIESVGNSEFRSLSSNIEIVLIHILKWEYQAGRRSRSWAGSIIEHRQRIGCDLIDSPSLKSRLQQAIDRGYRLARFVAARETNLPVDTFPKACPYDWDAIMDRAFIIAEIE